MNMTLDEIREKHAALVALKNKVLPQRIGYAIVKNLKEFEKELELMEERREKICKRYAQRDENGEVVIKNNQYVFETSEDNKRSREEVVELLNTETDVKVEKCERAALEECYTKEKYDIPTIAQLYALEFMIK